MTKPISQDIVFLSTSGIKKASKHLPLGLGINSLTRSQTVAETLNRMGQCVNYSKVEKLETKLTFKAYENSKETPFGIKTISEFNTLIAWYNCDVF